MRYFQLLFVIVSSILIFSCTKDDTPPYERIDGKWEIDQVVFLGSTIAGDGSYLQFNQCDTAPCPGIDYSASDTTMGTFTYEINDEATRITINDTTFSGGNYDAIWSVRLFTESQMQISTVFATAGEMRISMTKQ